MLSISLASLPLSGRGDCVLEIGSVFPRAAKSPCLYPGYKRDLGFHSETIYVTDAGDKISRAYRARVRRLSRVCTVSAQRTERRIRQILFASIFSKPGESTNRLISICAIFISDEHQRFPYLILGLIYSIFNIKYI